MKLDTKKDIWHMTPMHNWCTGDNEKGVCTGSAFSVFFLSFLRAKAECFARLSHRLGVCPSVCLSVTLVICIKTVQARITKSLPWAAPRSLVYCDKISCHWVQGFPSNKSVKEGYSLKKMSFCRYWLQ